LNPPPPPPQSPPRPKTNKKLGAEWLLSQAYPSLFQDQDLPPSPPCRRLVSRKHKTISASLILAHPISSTWLPYSYYCVPTQRRVGPTSPSISITNSRIRQPPRRLNGQWLAKLAPSPPDALHDNALGMGDTALEPRTNMGQHGQKGPSISTEQDWFLTGRCQPLSCPIRILCQQPPTSSGNWRWVHHPLPALPLHRATYLAMMERGDQ
jgi:hypothetical protein